MKVLAVLFFLTGISFAQMNITNEDKIMSEHVREVWQSATKDNYFQVFKGLISDCETFLQKNPNTSIKPGLLGYLFEMKAAVGETHENIMKLVDSLLVYDSSVDTKIRISKVLIQRQIDYKKPIEILKPLIVEEKEKEDIYDIYLLLAASEMHLNNFNSAIAYLNDAIKKDSTRIDGYKGLQQVYKYEGNKKEVENLEKKIAALKIDKNINVSLLNFSIDDISGKKIFMEEYQGKFVAMVFFSFECPFCKKELPVIKSLIIKHPDVKFLFINLNENETDIKNKFLKEDEFSFLKDQTIIKFADVFDKILDITITPQFLLLDKNLIVKYDYRGYEKDLEVKFEENLKALQ